MPGAIGIILAELVLNGSEARTDYYSLLDWAVDKIAVNYGCFQMWVPDTLESVLKQNDFGKLFDVTKSNLQDKLKEDQFSARLFEAISNSLVGKLVVPDEDSGVRTHDSELHIVPKKLMVQSILCGSTAAQTFAEATDSNSGRLASLADLPQTSSIVASEYEVKHLLSQD